MPTVSVVITSYNQKQYLVEALESVMAQSVRPLEILVADDCSSDGSPDLIQTYAKRHPGWIKPVLQQQNVGISENRNTALRQSVGDYVAVLDGDDRYLPDNLEKQLRALEASSDADCVYSNLYFIDSHGNRLRVRDKTPQPQGDIRIALGMGRMGLLRSMLAPRQLAEQVGFLDKRYPKHDGYIFTLRLARKARFVYVAEPLAEYRVHPAGDSKTFNDRQRLAYLDSVAEEVFRLVDGIPPQDVQRIRAIWFYRLLRLRFRIDAHANKITASLRGFRAILHHPDYWPFLKDYLAAKRAGIL
ncbi:glycosyltransferase [Candidatus Parcubacteria bacterium]|nr:MAG: glycosyltransferase [Candidatus Parcubacteria bacterium]